MCRRSIFLLALSIYFGGIVPNPVIAGQVFTREWWVMPEPSAPEFSEIALAEQYNPVNTESVDKNLQTAVRIVPADLMQGVIRIAGDFKPEVDINISSDVLETLFPNVSYDKVSVDYLGTTTIDFNQLIDPQDRKSISKFADNIAKQFLDATKNLILFRAALDERAINEELLKDDPKELKILRKATDKNLLGLYRAFLESFLKVDQGAEEVLQSCKSVACIKVVQNTFNAVLGVGERLGGNNFDGKLDDPVLIATLIDTFNKLREHQSSSNETMKKVDRFSFVFSKFISLAQSKLTAKEMLAEIVDVKRSMHHMKLKLPKFSSAKKIDQFRKVIRRCIADVVATEKTVAQQSSPTSTSDPIAASSEIATVIEQESKYESNAAQSVLIDATKAILVPPGASAVMEDDPRVPRDFAALGKNMYQIENLIWSEVASYLMTQPQAKKFCQNLGGKSKLPSKENFEVWRKNVWTGIWDEIDKNYQIAIENFYLRNVLSLADSYRHIPRHSYMSGLLPDGIRGKQVWSSSLLPENGGWTTRFAYTFDGINLSNNSLDTERSVVCVIEVR